MGALAHDVASVCAVACAALSLVLAMNMSRLRNKARSLGDKEREKAFLDGQEFAKARIVFAACASRLRVLRAASWREACRGFASRRHRRSATRLSTRRCSACSCCTCTRVQLCRVSPSAALQHTQPRRNAALHNAAFLRVPDAHTCACKHIKHRGDRIGGAVCAQCAGCGTTPECCPHDLLMGALHCACGPPGGYCGAWLTVCSRARRVSGPPGCCVRRQNKTNRSLPQQRTARQARDATGPSHRQFAAECDA